MMVMMIVMILMILGVQSLQEIFKDLLRDFTPSSFQFCKFREAEIRIETVILGVENFRGTVATQLKQHRLLDLHCW